MPTLVYKTVGHSTATTPASEQRPRHQHQQERQWPPNERQAQPQQRHKSSWPNASRVVVPFHHHQSALAAATNSALHKHSAATAAHSSVAVGAQPAAAARPVHTQQQAVPYHYHHRQDRHFGDNSLSFEYSSSLQHHHHHHQQQHHQPWHSADQSHGAGMSHHHHYQKPPPQHPHPNVTPPPIHHAPGTDDSFSNISDFVIQEQIDRAAQMLEEAQSTSHEDSRGEISPKMPPTSLVATTVVTPPGPYAPAAHPSPQSLVHPSVSGYSYGMDHPTIAHPPALRQQQQQERPSHASAHQPVHVHVHVHPKTSKKKARSTEKSASPTTTKTTCVDEHVDGDTLQYDLQYDIPPSLVGQGDQYQSFISNHVAQTVKKIVLSRPDYSKEKAKAVSMRTKVLPKKKLPKTKKSARPSTMSTIPISPMSSHRKKKKGNSPSQATKITTIHADVHAIGVVLKRAIPLGHVANTTKNNSPFKLTPSTNGASPSTATTATINADVNTDGPSLKQAIPLGLGQIDHNHLGEYMCFIRNVCVEVFTVNDDSVDCYDNKKRNQVGIRCRFCACRGRGMQVFPRFLSFIPNSVLKLMHYHFPSCPKMPHDVRERYNSLEARYGSAPHTSMGRFPKYWADSARVRGLVDTEAGIRMVWDVT